MKILSCDAGSHSFKAAIYEFDGVPPLLPVQPPLWEGSITWAKAGSPAQIRDSRPGSVSRDSSIVLESPRRAPERLLQSATSAPTASSGWRDAVDAAVHRVVHAGDFPTATSQITEPMKHAIATSTQFAPGHNPVVLAAVEAVDHLAAARAQIAVFDAAFHVTLPPEASSYAVPRSWRDVWGIRKMGFHGISHRYAATRAAAMLGRSIESVKIITCHLGGGASLAAVDGGRSVDTTMGWTTLDGLVMSERCGSIDPGILLHLLRRNRYTAEELSQQLHEHSGLFGLSGLSGDMRDIVAATARGIPRAKLALDVYTHRLRSAIGSMAAALGGVDAIVFTGGVGENAPLVRAAACQGLGFLGVEVDSSANEAVAADADISPAGQRVRVFVVRSEERWAMAREAAQLLTAST